MYRRSNQSKQVNAYRRQLDVRVAGFEPPKPVQTFGQCGFDHVLLGAIKRAGYDNPTAIQAQALPAALSGRDILVGGWVCSLTNGKWGWRQLDALNAVTPHSVANERTMTTNPQALAKTGSGKTAAFVLPMLVHVLDQPEPQKGQGPVALVLAPTRELAEQIHKEARRFAKPYNLRVVAAFGGLSKFDQVKELKAGAEVRGVVGSARKLAPSNSSAPSFAPPLPQLHQNTHPSLPHPPTPRQAAVATPGRMIDLIKMKACTLGRVTYTVLDEADRMLDMGFEPQVMRSCVI